MTLYTVRCRSVNGYTYVAAVTINTLMTRVHCYDPELAMRFDTKECAEKVRDIVNVIEPGTAKWHVHEVEVIVKKKEEHNENHS